MPINPHSPFARQYVDLPTDVALKLEAAARAAGKSKKQFFAEAIQHYMEFLESPKVEASTPATTKRKAR